MNQRFVLSSIAAVGWAIGIEGVATASNPTPDLTRVRQHMAALTVPFVPNAGQWDARAAFAAHTFAGTLFVTTEGQLVYHLPGKEIDDLEVEGVAVEGATIRGADPAGQSRLSRAAARPRGPGGVLTETMVDRAGHALMLAPRGSSPQAGKVSYFLGDDASRHRSALATYERVSLGELSTGIDLQLRATGSNVEKIFTIAPMRDPNAIRVRLGGANRLALGPDGELIVHTALGSVIYSAPIAYQDEGAGRRAEVAVRYALASDRETYGFALGDYDRSRPLVIDPLLQATYVGGTLGDVIYAMAIHPATGEVLVAGFTTSADLLCTSGGGCPTGGAQPAKVVDVASDAFIARFAPDLKTLLQATYLGGNGSEGIYAMTVHPVSGEVVVAGRTTSTNFPGTAGGAGSGINGFVARLNADLTSLLKAVYFSRATENYINAVAIHPVSGEILVSGRVDSQPFVNRYSADLNSEPGYIQIISNFFSEFLALAVHPVTGDVYAAGTTSSTNLPCTAPGIPGCVTGAQTAPASVYGEGFVYRFPGDLTGLLQGTYLGGSGSDRITAMAIHPASGEVLVAGATDSTDLQCTTSATAGCGAGAQGVGQPGHHSFAARLNAGLTRLLQTTYIGGSIGEDQVNAIAIHPATGEVLLAGRTRGDLPCTQHILSPNCGDGAQPVHAAVGGGVGDDGFIVRLNASLTSMLQATYLGGSRDDEITAMAIHPSSGEVFVAGYTLSTNLPCASTLYNCANGAQPSNAGGTSDGFIARLSADLTFNDNMPDAFAFAPQANVPVSSIRTSNPVLIAGIANAGLAGGAVVYVDGQPGSKYCVSSTNSCATCDISGMFVGTRGTIDAGRYVCVRHTASAALNQATYTDLHVGGAMARFLATTGTLLGSNCTLDVDGNNSIDALTDGLLLLRAMFGLTGTAVTNGAVGSGAARTDWAAIRSHLNANCGASFAP